MTSAEASLIDNIELLTRFVLSDRWKRDDGTLRPVAFLPFPHVALSVTRHAGMPEAELWKRGQQVSVQRDQPLLGRADLIAGAVRSVSPLDVLAAPLDDNQEHARIVGWTADKPSQLSVALQLAALSQFVPAQTPVSPPPPEGAEAGR